MKVVFLSLAFIAFSCITFMASASGLIVKPLSFTAPAVPAAADVRCRGRLIFYFMFNTLNA